MSLVLGKNGGDGEHLQTKTAAPGAPQDNKVRHMSTVKDHRHDSGGSGQ